MCSIDLAPCEVWREQPRRARKPHRCATCHRTIEAGDHYLDHFDIFEGDCTCEKMCFQCWCVRDSFAQDHGQSASPSYFLTLPEECIDGSDEGARWATMLAAIKSKHAGAAP